MEPMGQLRQRPGKKGVTMASREQKLAPSARDLLITRAQPTQSLPMVMELGLLSGYKININKTEVLTFHYNPQSEANATGNGTVSPFNIKIMQDQLWPVDLKTNQIYKDGMSKFPNRINQDECFASDASWSATSTVLRTGRLDSKVTVAGGKARLQLQLRKGALKNHYHVAQLYNRWSVHVRQLTMQHGRERLAESQQLLY